jgi:N-acetylneuraminate lyase
MKKMTLKGLVPASFTPMNADGSLNLPRIDKLAEFAIKDQAAAVFVCGTTGEGQSLTYAERTQVTERWISVLAGQIPVIVHVGHTCLEEAQHLARHAERSGAAAISALAPYFIKPALHELGDFCRELAAAAPSTPFYYYHIPSMTGVSVPIATFLEEFGEKIPTLAGIKFTFENLMDLQNAMRIADGRWQMLFGRDESLLPALSLGCVAGVGSTYNYAAPVYQRVLAAYQAGDLATAQTWQMRAAHFISVIVKYGGLAAMKPIMTSLGRDCGPTRSPLRRLTSEEASRLEAELRGIGFYDWVA